MKLVALLLDFSWSNIQGEVKKKGTTTRTSEYFCIRFGVSSPTFLPLVYYLMKIGVAYRKHEFLTGARFFMKQLHALKIMH